MKTSCSVGERKRPGQHSDPLGYMAIASGHTALESGRASIDLHDCPHIALMVMRVCGGGGDFV